MARVFGRLASSALVLAVLFTAYLPAAQLLQPSIARADANSEARVFFERANRQLAAALRLRGERRTRALEDALGSYVSSLRIVRSRNAVFNAGVTLQELGRADEAFDYFVEYQAMPGITDAERADVTQRVEAMRARLALIVVQSSPPAEVRIDRRDLAVRGTTGAPLELAVAPGEHLVYLSAAGHEDAQVRVNAVVGERTRVTLQLTPRPGALRVLAPAGAVATLDGSAVATGSVVSVPAGVHALRVVLAGRTLAERSVEILPGGTLVEIDATRRADTAASGPGQLEVVIDVPARVLVDGAQLGFGRRVLGSLSAGTHRLRVETAGRLPYQSTITVQSDNRTHLDVTLGVDPQTLTELGAWPTVALVATTATLTLGLVVGIVGLASNTTYEADLATYSAGPQTLTAYEDLRAQREQTVALNALADVFWISTLALGVTTLILYLVDDDDPGGGSTGSVTIAPLAGNGLFGGMLALRLP